VLACPTSGSDRRPRRMRWPSSSTVAGSSARASADPMASLGDRAAFSLVRLRELAEECQTQRVARPRRPPPSEQPASRPRLTVPRDEFASELDAQIAKGLELKERAITSKTDLQAAKADYYTWNEFNAELLKHRFTNSEIADEYERWSGGVAYAYDSLHDRIEDFHEDVDGKLRRLVSVRERLPLFEEPSGAAGAATRRASSPPQGTHGERTIFVVHGRSEATKLAVHGFLRDVAELESVVLHDQPSQGRTIIEKFEDYAERAAFAVVLLTGDDHARTASQGDGEPELRARQNVVFELGFFFGALGRHRVAVLYEPGVELPSDIDGLIYIPLDDGGGWKLLLAKELKAAGIAVVAEKML